MRMTIMIETRPAGVFRAIMAIGQHQAGTSRDAPLGASGRELEWSQEIAGSLDRAMVHIQRTRKDEFIAWTQDWPAAIDVTITLAPVTGPATWLVFTSTFQNPEDETAENIAALTAVVAPFFRGLQDLCEAQRSTARTVPAHA